MSQLTKQSVCVIGTIATIAIVPKYVKLPQGLELLFQDRHISVSYRKEVFTKENPWTTCKIIERMFPAYYTKQNPDFGLNTQQQEIDFVNINTALCIILLLLVYL